MSPLSDGINDDHNAVLPIGLRKFRDEVHAHDLPRFVRNRKRVKFSGGRLAYGLRPEAHVACGNIPANVPGHIGPPVVTRHELQSLPTSSVSGDLGVMAKRDYPTAQICRIRNVDFSTEIKQTVGEGPLGGTDGTGGRCPELLEGLNDRLLFLPSVDTLPNILQNVPLFSH
jgi:hypothetical protein